MSTDASNNTSANGSLPEKNFVEIANDVGRLVAKKNIAYGNSFEQAQRILSVLFPNGVPPASYRDFLTITRIIDKLFRIATDKKAFHEDPWRDIAGYAILSIWAQQPTRQFNVRGTRTDRIRVGESLRSNPPQPAGDIPSFAPSKSSVPPPPPAEELEMSVMTDGTEYDANAVRETLAMQEEYARNEKRAKSASAEDNSGGKSV